jgi:electron transfer flavoprotein beta subunit
VNIGVFVKLVPPSDVRISIEGEGGGSSVDKSVYSKLGLNPYDDYALEEAVRLKEAGNADKVIVFSVDSRSGIDSELRMALAKGGDEVVLIDDAGFTGADTITVAAALVAAAKEEDIGLILCGKESIDMQSAQLPPMVAELLGWSLATAITKLEMSDDGFKAWRDVGGGNQGIIAGSLPAVLSCDKGLNEPRFVKLQARMKSKKKPFHRVSLGDLDLDAEIFETKVVSVSDWSLPPQRSECAFIEGTPEQMVSQLITRLKEEAKVL